MALTNCRKISSKTTPICIITFLAWYIIHVAVHRLYVMYNYVTTLHFNLCYLSISMYLHYSNYYNLILRVLYEVYQIRLYKVRQHPDDLNYKYLLTSAIQVLSMMLLLY